MSTNSMIPGPVSLERVSNSNSQKKSIERKVLTVTAHLKGAKIFKTFVFQIM